MLGLASCTLFACAHSPMSAAPARPASAVTWNAFELRRACGTDERSWLWPVSPSIEIAEGDFVTLEREGCHGACPIYSVTLFGSGRVVGVGTRFVRSTGGEWWVDPALARRVLSEFQRLDFFTEEDSLLLAITDLPSARITAKHGQQTRVVRHYGAGAESLVVSAPLLSWFERLVDDATEAEARIVGCDDSWSAEPRHPVRSLRPTGSGN